MRRLEVRRVPSPGLRWYERTEGGCEEAEREGGGGELGDGGEAGVVQICAECDRFLFNMMRLISGTLVQVGLGKLTPDDVSALLRARKRSGEGPQACRAPASGLCLDRVFYGECGGD